MELSWFGLSCFRLTERGSASVVTDPFPAEYGHELALPRSDIVTISRLDPFRTESRVVKGPSRIIDGPGEYEIGGVFVTGVAVVSSKSKSTPAVRNIIFAYDYAGITICHLGGLNHLPNQSQIQALGTVNVLLTPVGGSDLISPSQASEVISMLEPNLVIPMHYSTPGFKLKLPAVSGLLKEMGTNNVQSVDVLKVSKSTLPEETQVVLLEPQTPN